jgi:hypothetical protein
MEIYNDEIIAYLLHSLFCATASNKEITENLMRSGRAPVIFKNASEKKSSSTELYYNIACCLLLDGSSFVYALIMDMGAVCVPRTLVDIYLTTQHYIPEDNTLQ